MQAPPAGPPNLLALLQASSNWLQDRGVESPRLNAELLLSHHLRCQRLELYLRFDRPVPPEIRDPLRADLHYRAEGTPLQHLLGSVDFLGREFRCDARALIPRPETEVLVQHCLELPLPAAARVVDIGCGSGVIALSLAAARPGWRVTGVDVSPEALGLSRDNADALGLLTGCGRVEFTEGNLLANFPAEPGWELIVSNPPYIPRGELAELAPEVQRDPVLALDGGADGLDLVRPLIDQAAARLVPGGWLALEVGHDQGETVAALLRQRGFVEVGLWSDLEGIARFPHGRWPEV